MSLNATVKQVTDRIRERSKTTRAPYLARVERDSKKPLLRKSMACANLAHAFAAAPEGDKIMLHEARVPNIGIVTAYNDMLSAHQPYEHYPDIIRQAARKAGATAQVAGGVPAMCDGVTQGEEGMELSLFSRDVIAQGTAIALSHKVFDAALCLGVCDKIVPGLVMGALQFGHLPIIFVPAGPMTTGISNDDKSKVRQLFAQGKVGREALLASEAGAYHGPGTCTFYGTANSNQMLMEMMGLHLPGAAFVTPNTPLRDALTAAAAERAAKMSGGGGAPMGQQIDERVIVNAIVGLLATGGSTNHTMHLVAMARAAGIIINWDDFSALSDVVPLLARVYPNGKADVNHFHAAGGMGFLTRELLAGGYLHEDVDTVVGKGMARYGEEPWLNNGQLEWRPAPAQSGDEDVLRPVTNPFSKDGGLKLIRGVVGRGVVKISAVKPEHRKVQAPALTFNDQNDVIAAYKRGELNRDFIAVLRFQGPRANGMPELHRLTPILVNLQEEGKKVALVTDGRMSGASGKVPGVIHMTPETLAGGNIGKIRDGDMLTLDCEAGTLDIAVPQAELEARTQATADLSGNETGIGRDIFGLFRRNADSAEEGASAIL